MLDVDARAAVVETARRARTVRAVCRLTGCVAVAAVVITGCGAAARGVATTRPKPPHSAATPDDSHFAVPATRTEVPSKVLVVMEENHSARQAQAGMPYLMSLAHRYGYDANYHAVGDPSLPNYLAIAAGSTFGISDDDDPSAHPIGGQTVFDQAIAAGKRAKAYVESMPHSCDLTNAAPYAVRHNPWTYFTSSRRRCAADDMSTASLLADVRSNSLPNVGMVTPNLNDDAHDGTLAQADSWLKKRVPAILSSSDFTSGQPRSDRRFRRFERRP